MDDASQDISPASGSHQAPRWPGYWKTLVDSLMWSSVVVIVHIFAQRPCKVPLIEDQDLVKTRLAYRPHPAFRERISFGRLKGCLNNFDAFGDKDRVERGREFRIPIVDEVTIGLRAIFQFPDELARLLGHPMGTRMSRAASQVDSSCSSMKKST